MSVPLPLSVEVGRICTSDWRVEEAAARQREGKPQFGSLPRFAGRSQLGQDGALLGWMHLVYLWTQFSQINL